MNAFLILEDGHVFPGKAYGSCRDVISEIVFNTSMTGYTEVLTDPSYSGQAVVMTYPLIGNYGVCLEDMESEKPWLSGFIVRELSRIPANFRSDETIQSFLLRYDIPCIAGVDTRAVTKLLREKGTMRGMIAHTETKEALDTDALLEQIRAYHTGDEVARVSRREPERLPRAGLKVALMDYGVKENIARCLHARGCDVTIWPASTPAEEVLASDPDGIMLSNGPGDPKEYKEVIREVRKLYDSDVTVFAICLGHQLMALALGGDTHRMKYGHRGANHPVRDLRTGKVYLSSQNHGYVVDEKSLPETIAVPAFENVNDGTNEGMNYIGKNIFTVQFHPEASPGPHDTAFLFDRFIEMMNQKKAEERSGKNA
ncbi:MAG: carbamoyl phosphate synthase small subunit [Eubacteriales bacterium]|nr:carbamoyl phosphate synthase small subunit [Eubacteriales bacterium]